VESGGSTEVGGGEALRRFAERGGSEAARDSAQILRDLDRAGGCSKEVLELPEFRLVDECSNTSGNY